MLPPAQTSLRNCPALPVDGLDLLSEARVDRLAFQRQHPEDALVDAPQRLHPREALQRLDTERELAQRQRALCRQAARAEPLQVVRGRVLRTVDDAQVLLPAALHG